MGLFDYPMEASAAAASGPVAEAFVFLEALPGDAWEKILAIVETRHFRRGDNIITRGEHDDSFYILSSGAVSVVVPDKRGRDSVIAEIPEGSVFGEIAFFAREPRSETIRAQTDGSAIRVTRKNSEHLGAWQPLIARQMLLDLGHILALRLRWTSSKVKN
jgi:CRP/FNR family cyclic AMP-dependent transcriptional regulator